MKPSKPGFNRLAAAWGVLLVLSLACGGVAETVAPSPTATEAPGAGYTQAIQTHIAAKTLEAALYTPTPRTRTPTPEPSATLVLTPTATATLTPLPLTGGTLILFDNFESLENWYTGRTEDYVLEFLEGGYRIFVNLLTGPSPVYSVHEQPYGDIRVEVDVMRVRGPDGGYFGLVCRFNDAKNYYRFVIDQDGYYEIAKKVNGVFSILGSGTQRHLFRVGGQVNHLRGDCYSGTLTLYVNDERILQVMDGDLTNGGTGLVVGTNLEAGLEVLFDNFALYQP